MAQADGRKLKQIPASCLSWFPGNQRHMGNGIRELVIEIQKIVFSLNYNYEIEIVNNLLRQFKQNSN
jgi:hypothetical protein